MEQNYMHMKGQKRSPITSRNPEVMFKLHMVSVDMIKTEKRKFMSLRLVGT